MQQKTASAEEQAKKIFGEDIEKVLSAYLPEARWFRSKGDEIADIGIEDLVPISSDDASTTALVFVKVSYDRKSPEFYLMGLGIAPEQNSRPEHTISKTSGDEAVLYNAFADPEFGKSLLQMILEQETIEGSKGKLVPARYFDIQHKDVPLPSFNALEQSNSSLTFGNQCFMKVFRNLSEGVNPEVEIGAHFATKAHFKNVPRIIGALSYLKDKEEYSLAAVHEYIEAKGSSWDYFLSCIEKVSIAANSNNDVADTSKLQPDSSFPEWFLAEIRPAGKLMDLLGQRTAEMHKALGSDAGDEHFIPESFSEKNQKELYQSVHDRAARVRKELAKHASRKEASQKLINDLEENWNLVDRHLETLNSLSFAGHLIRIHGDYHFGQVLFTGNDFIILDFEGEPLRSIEERRQKRLPLQDVAGMLRSIDYAINYYLKDQDQDQDHNKSDWLRLWRDLMCDKFMTGYLNSADINLLPGSPVKVNLLTEILMLEKALYEVEYELSSRPDWVSIPLNGLRDLLHSLTNPEEAQQ